MQPSQDKVNKEIKKLTDLIQEYPTGSPEYNQVWIARQALLYTQNPDYWSAPSSCIVVVNG